MPYLIDESLLEFLNIGLSNGFAMFSHFYAIFAMFSYIFTEILQILIAIYFAL